MIRISIQDLKRNLSACLARAEAGEALLITRHGRPVVRITTAANPHLHVGKNFGRAKLRPAIDCDLGGRALEVLEEDRRDRFDDLYPRR